MDNLKRYLGFLWMLAGPVILIALIAIAAKNIDINGTTDISKPIPWIIIISIFTPVAIGLTIFGWYAWKGEYDKEQ
ncbi:MAG: hypothetical protein H7Y27_03740 [Gemmatimonadaceae bacterium]|nr:hypothetical protein [Chitinophagaceae bacterium]